MSEEKEIPVGVMADELHWVTKVLADFRQNRQALHPQVPGIYTELRMWYNQVCDRLEVLQSKLYDRVVRAGGIKYADLRAHVVFPGSSDAVLGGSLDSQRLFLHRTIAGLMAMDDGKDKGMTSLKSALHWVRIVENQVAHLIEVRDFVPGKSRVKPFTPEATKDWKPGDPWNDNPMGVGGPQPGGWRAPDGKMTYFGMNTTNRVDGSRLHIQLAAIGGHIKIGMYWGKGCEPATRWPVDPHAPSNFNNHPETNINTWRENLLKAEQNPTAAAFAWEALEKKLDEHVPVRSEKMWNNIEKHMKKSERIRLMQNDIASLRQQLTEMQKRFEDHLAKNMPASLEGSPKFEAHTGMMHPTDGKQVYGHVYGKGACIAWYTTGSWYVQMVGHPIQTVADVDLTWYKKIS